VDSLQGSLSVSLGEVSVGNFLVPEGGCLDELQKGARRRDVGKIKVLMKFQRVILVP
jgi:hypothetical protein